MVVQTKISRIDLLRMQLYLLFRISANFYFFLLLWTLMAFSTWSALEEHGVVAYLLTVTIIAIGAFFGAIVFCGILQLIFASEKHGFIGPHQFEIRPDGFSETTKGTTTVTNWAGVQRLFRFRSYLFLMISTFRVHIIPRRAFESEEAFQNFADSIESHMGGA